MLALQTIQDDTILDLPDNAKIDITGSNPAFDQDAVARVFSFPFKLPASPRNLRAMQHINRVDAKRVGQARIDRAARLWVAGGVFKEGFLKVGEVTPDTIECSFSNLDRELLDDWSKIKIRSLMPVVNIPQTAHAARWEYTLLPVPYLYFITINGTQLYFDATLSGTQNDAGLGLAAAINAVYPGSATYISPTNTLVVLALDYDPFVVTATIQGVTLVSAKNPPEAVQLNLTTYVKGVGNSPIASHSFPTLRHNGLYGQQNFTFSGYVNYRHDDVMGINEPDSTGMNWQYAYIPYVKLKYVFDQIAAASGIEWAGEFYESQDFADLRIWANYALDDVYFDWFTDNFRYMNAGKTSFDLAFYVPDLDAKAFILKIFDVLNLYPISKGTSVSIMRRKDQVNAAVRQLELVDPTYRMTVTPRQGVTLRFKDILKDQAKQIDQLEDYVVGDGGIVQEVEVTPLYERSILDNVTETNWRMCFVQEKGSSDELGVGINACPLRLFFDRGLQEDEDGLEYPMSTNQATNMAGDPVGELSLSWEGDTGLYAQLWEGWAVLQDNAPVEISAILPVSTARDLLRWERPVLQFWHPLGEVRVIVKNIQFDVDAASGELVKCKLETIRLT